MARRKSEQETREFELLMEKLPLFPDYVQKYIHYRKSKLTTGTLSNYLIDFRFFFEWLIEEGIHDGSIHNVPLSCLETLSLEKANRFREILKDSFEDSTTNRRLSALKSLFNYLSQIAEDDEGFALMKRNVMAKIELVEMKESKKYRAKKIQQAILQVTPERNEILEFIEHVKSGHRAKIVGNKRLLDNYEKNMERDLAAIALCLDSGIRAFELVALNVQDIQFSDNSIMVRRGKGNKKDIIYFGDLAYVYLKDYLAVREGRYAIPKDFPPLFVSSGTGPKGKPDRMTKRNLQYIVERYAKTFDKSSLTVHKLRHSFASAFYQKNNNIIMLKEQLRHESTQTTEIYTHVNNQALREAVVRTNDIELNEK
ncbi:tyrosine recombinase XerS [Aneurinibacillus thermoaerophilus]|uniref:tyrosine recombinase XerS n=1 Tax=Aneurinibacillus thermoaerophilus TaxID=143495 RepID=UPI002E1A164B|nr:tyrosine recombinase XerS [Aneurinibacillus thermoaerophilus]MED0675259.1 tyrosine recombinase XerS [Aneurinibacillus thermoaerophilus]